MLEQLQTENAQLKQEAQAKQQETDARTAAAKMQADATIEAARIRAESQALADERVAMINAEVERDRIASQERIAMCKPMPMSAPAEDIHEEVI